MQFGVGDGGARASNQYLHLGVVPLGGGDWLSTVLRVLHAEDCTLPKAAKFSYGGLVTSSIHFASTVQLLQSTHFPPPLAATRLFLGFSTRRFKSFGFFWGLLVLPFCHHHPPHGCSTTISQQHVDVKIFGGISSVYDGAVIHHCSMHAHYNVRSRARAIAPAARQQPPPPPPRTLRQ